VPSIGKVGKDRDVSIIIGYRTLGARVRCWWRMHGSLFNGMYRTVVIRPILSLADCTDRSGHLRALMGSASMVHR
jgi:hypothetical protein